MPDELSFGSSILERGVSEVAQVFDLFEAGVYCVDLEGRFTYMNPAGEALLGWDQGELLGRHAHDTIHHSRPDGAPFPRDECRFYEALHRARAERDPDDLFWRRDGSTLHVAHSIAPLYEDREHVGAIVVFGDVGDRDRATKLLHAGAAQHAALSEIGLLALGGRALHNLFQHACVMLAGALHVEFSKVLELVDEQHSLRLVAGVGWRPDTIGATYLGLGEGSQAGFALVCDQPVVVSDWRTESRFQAPPLFCEHDVMSGVSVVIHGRDRPWGTAPWGVLGAHSSSPRTFTREEIDFLSSVANTLALAIERSEAERELRQRNAEVTQLADEVSKLADDRRRIMADALDAEDHARERISQLLHDEVLQSLLSARQDLATAQRSGGHADDAVGRASEAVVDAIGELRNAVVALHPVTRAKGGVAAAIEATAEVHARRGGFKVSVNVMPKAGGVRDQLIVSLARELLNNVAQHAQASHVTINLIRADDGVVFEVRDDGCGMDPRRPGQALDQGHIGLASIALRVESIGGRFELITNPGRGTRVRLALPTETDTDRHGG